jgi:membrane protease YdiL (CAAX protease family)
MENIVLVIFVASWLLLRFEGKGLQALGFDQPARRGAEFALGFMVFGIAAIVQQYGFALQNGFQWQINPEFTDRDLAWHAFWNVRSVLTEELLFRGYALYLLLRFVGRNAALWIDAAAFGIYHWFTFGLLGNIPVMAVVFFYTGAFGLVLALAFRQTGSVALPIGLHLGWNLIIGTVFSGGMLGKALLIPSSGPLPPRVVGLPGLLLSVVLPLAVSASVAWWVCRERPGGIRYQGNGTTA